MKNYIFFSIIFLNLSINSQWTSLNFINGGTVNNIVQDSSGVFLISTINNQIYRSTSSGNNWQNITNNFPYITISAFMSDINYIYLGTMGNGVYRSSNKGDTWQQFNNGLITLNINCFLKNNQFIFAATANGVCRSSNNGINWIPVTNGMGNTHNIYSMVSMNDIIFAATSLGSTGTMYKSSNNGANWETVNNGLPTFYMDKLAAVPGRVFASSRTVTGIYQTTDIGASWSVVPGQPANTMPSALIFRDNVILAPSSTNANTEDLTTNSGTNWFTITNDLPQNCTINNGIVSQNYCIGVTNKGVFKSTNLGYNWTSSNSGIRDIEIIQIAAKDNNVILSAFNYGIYRSSDYGISWNFIPQVNHISYLSNQIKWVNNDLYIDQVLTIKKSTDFGQSFINYVQSLPNDTRLTYISGNTIIAGTRYEGIYKSTNQGTSWFQSNSGINYVALLGILNITKANDKLFIYVNNYLGSPDTAQLFFSTNNGDSWNSTGNNGLPKTVSVIQYNENDNSLYAGTRTNGVYWSSNGGYNWSVINDSLPQNVFINSIFINGDTIFVSTYQNGIFKCRNQHHLWIAHNENIVNLRMNTITGSNNYLYAGGKFNSPYRRNLNFITGINNFHGIPVNFRLSQNYPNPFNPTTNFKMSLPIQINIKLVIFDIAGKEIAVIAEGNYKPGEYSFTWNAENFASGVYFYKLYSKEFSSSGRMVLLK